MTDPNCAKCGCLYVAHFTVHRGGCLGMPGHGCGPDCRDECAVDGCDCREYVPGASPLSAPATPDCASTMPGFPAAWCSRPEGHAGYHLYVTSAVVGPYRGAPAPSPSPRAAPDPRDACPNCDGPSLPSSPRGATLGWRTCSDPHCSKTFRRGTAPAAREERATPCDDHRPDGPDPHPDCGCARIDRLMAAPAAVRNAPSPRCPHGDPLCMCQAPMDPSPRAAPEPDIGALVDVAIEAKATAREESIRRVCSIGIYPDDEIAALCAKADAARSALLSAVEGLRRERNDLRRGEATCIDDDGTPFASARTWRQANAGAESRASRAEAESHDWQRRYNEQVDDKHRILTEYDEALKRERAARARAEEEAGRARKALALVKRIATGAGVERGYTEAMTQIRAALAAPDTTTAPATTDNGSREGSDG